VESKVHSALRPPMAYCASPGWLWWWRNRWNYCQGKPKYSEKTCPVPLCPPQTPRAARTRTPAAAVWSQRLTAWATARPEHSLSNNCSNGRMHHTIAQPYCTVEQLCNSASINFSRSSIPSSDGSSISETSQSFCTVCKFTATGIIMTLYIIILQAKNTKHTCTQT
jgi:hypothetical protein